MSFHVLLQSHSWYRWGVIHYTYCVRQKKNKFLGWHPTLSPVKQYLKVAILYIIDQILMNNNNVPENPKFQDNSGMRALLGQRLAFRDCPGHSGTYVYTGIPPSPNVLSLFVYLSQCCHPAIPIFPFLLQVFYNIHLQFSWLQPYIKSTKVLMPR